MDEVSTTERTIITGLQHVAHFKLIDYGIFFIMLGVSVGIGLYFAYFDKKPKTVDDYLLGGKAMRPLPIAFSLVAGSISGITLIGVPSEVYTEGATYILTLPSMLAVSIFAKYFYLPIYYDLRITSIYEYLELRFNRRVRLLTSSFYNISYLLYMPAVVYVPSLSLSQATGINLHVISSVTTLICVFYTMIGGIKAVVWTDFLQLLALLMATFSIVGIGTANVGGFGTVFDLANKGDKLNIFDFDPNPFQRQSFWICTFGPIFNWMITLGSSQSNVQRFLSLPSAKDVTFVLIVYFLGYAMITALSVYNGLLIYATYFGCDPIENKFIEREDQIFPYFVLDKTGHIPGLSGIFLAGVVSAALSTLSTGLNTSAGVIYEDFIKKDSITEKKARLIMKVMVVLVGIFCIFAVMLFENIGKILSASYAITSVVYTPVGVLFFLGMFFPWANTKGVITGALACTALLSWISFGATVSKINFAPKGIYPEEYETCSNVTAAIRLSQNATAAPEIDDVFPLYKMSFLVYSFVGITFGTIVGLIVSYFTGPTDPADVDPRLISPPLRRFLPKRKTVTDPAEIQKMMVEMTESANGNGVKQ